MFGAPGLDRQLDLDLAEAQPGVVPAMATSSTLAPCCPMRVSSAAS